MTLVEPVNTTYKKINGLEVFIIPEQIKEGINQGKDDTKKGKVYTMKDFDEKYEKWLDE